MQSNAHHQTAMQAPGYIASKIQIGHRTNEPRIMEARSTLKDTVKRDSKGYRDEEPNGDHEWRPMITLIGDQIQADDQIGTMQLDLTIIWNDDDEVITLDLLFGKRNQK
eukprot:33402_1